MNQYPAQDKHFNTDHLQTGLKGRSIRGSFISVGSRGINILLQLGTTAVLARLIAPEGFGLVAMVLAGLYLLMNFRDAGLSVATVQRPEINQDQVSALFWINTAVGATLMLFMIILAPAFVWLYDEPCLKNIVLAISAIFLFDGLAVQHRALLMRQMRFSAMAAIRIISQAVSKIVAISMALMGLGYWALVVMPIVVSVCRLFMTWPLSGWSPGMLKKTVGIRSMIAFGMNLTGRHLVSFFSDQLDNILIGRFCGAYSLGLYSRAYNLVSMPRRLINWPMASVLIPSLSVLQDKPERYRRFFRRAIEKIVFFGHPIAALLILAADEIIMTLLGDQWRQAIPIFRLLGIWGFITASQSGAALVLISLDQTRRLLKWTGIGSSVRCLFIVLGLHWGAIGVAVGISVSDLALKLPELLYCYRKTPITLSDFWTATWRSTAASLTALGLGYLLLKTILSGISNCQIRLLAICAAFGIFYFAIFAALPRGLEELKDLLEKVVNLKSAE